MTEEGDKRYLEIVRAQQAKDLLNNAVFIEVIEKLRNEFITNIEQAPIRDVEGQHKIVLMIKVLNKIVSAIQDYVTTGKFAAVELEDKKRFGIF